MKKVLRGAVLAMCSFVAVHATAQTYLSWPKVDVGAAFWHVDKETITKVGNTIFFDGYINNEPGTSAILTPARGGLSCDGSYYFRIAEAWGQDYAAAEFDLKGVLDKRTSIELQPSRYSVAREFKTPQLKSRLAALCKTTKRPDRTLYMVVSTSSTKKHTLARLSTFVRLNPTMVEIWMDDVEQTTFQPRVYQEGKWVPRLQLDGTPSTSPTLSEDRTAAVRWRVDCARQRFAFTAMVEYAANGVVKKNYPEITGPIPDREWSGIVPDSVGETTVNTLCDL